MDDGERNEKGREFLKGLALRLDPQDPHAHNNIAVIMFRKGLAEEAISELEKALNIDPNFEPARRNLEAILSETGKSEEVLGFYLAKARELPDLLARKLATAEALANMGRESEALAEFMSVLRERPDETRALLGAARILRKRRDYHGAEGLLKKVVELDPGCAEAYRMLGEVHYNTQQLDLALRELEKARDLEPESAETYFLLSFVYGEKGLLDQALECVEKASSLNPKLTEAEELLTIEPEAGAEAAEAEGEGDPFQSRIELAEAYLSKGLFSDAEREINKAKKFASGPEEHHKALLSEALLYFLKGNYSTGTLVLNSIPQPGTDAVILRALCSFHMGRGDVALDLLEKAAETGDEFACLNYGVALFVAKRDAGLSLRYLDKAKILPASLYDKAFILMSIKDYEGAQEALEEYRKTRGDTVHYHNLSGEIMMAQGDDRGAEAEFLKALRIDPGFGDALVGLGSIYFSRRNFGRFFEFMRQARAIKYHHKRNVLFMSFRGLSFDIPVEMKEPLPSPEELADEDVEKTIERLLNQGKYGAVLALVDALLRENPFDQRLLRAKARTLFRSGRFKEAREYFSALEKLSPEDRVFWTLSEEWLGNWPMALKHVLHMIKEDKEDPGAWAWAGRILFRLRRFKEAEMFLKKALLLDPQNPEALFWAGEMFLAQSNSEEIKRIAQSLLSSGDPRGYIFLGEIAFLAERYDEATSHLDKALKEGVDRARVLYLMGLMSAIRGQYASAVARWKEVEKLAYDQVLAWKARQNIAQLENLRAYLRAEVAKQGGNKDAAEG